MVRQDTVSRLPETDSGAVRTERVVALIFAIAALVHGIVGILRGFGMIGTEGVNLAPIGIEDVGGLQAAIAPNFWEAMVWFSTGLAAGIVAWSFAGGRARTGADTRPMMRWIAWVMAATTLILIVVGLLAGFGMINDEAVATDGVLWGMLAIISGVLTAAAYSAIPETVAREDYLVALVESRTTGTMTASSTMSETRPGAEPMR